MSATTTRQPEVSTLEWWTPREVANLLRYDTSTVIRWCQTKKIDAAQLPGGTWRIHSSTVDKLQAGGLPEKRRRQQATVDPEWESASDYFDESPKPKARA